MATPKIKQYAAFIAVLMAVLAIVCFMGTYAAAVDTIFAHLVLKGQFFPATGKFYIVTSDINRLLLQPTTQLYKLWPTINWFDLTVLVPNLISTLLVLLVVYLTLIKTLMGKWRLPIAMAITFLWGLTILETIILFDPFSPTLAVPLLLFLVPSFFQGKWGKAISYTLLFILLLFCLQLRAHGIYIGLLVAVALVGINQNSFKSFWQKHKFALVIIITSFGLYAIGCQLQDQQLTKEEERIKLMDQYVYTCSDGLYYFKEGGPNFSNPVDSIKLLAYLSFYFPENADTAIALLDQVTYKSVAASDLIKNIPIKWDWLWQQPKVTDAMWYYNFNRLLCYLAISTLFMWIVVMLYGRTKAWYFRASFWSMFAWAYFISIGVFLKMPYKLAAPLLLLLLLGFLLLSLQVLREQSQGGNTVNALIKALGLSILIGIAGGQLWMYSALKQDRETIIQQKEQVVKEINTLFADKLLVFDFFSMLLLENNIGHYKAQPILSPQATMIGDYYTSLMPAAKANLERIAGTAELDGFFKYCATHQVVLVMSKYRVDFIKAYLNLVKGVSIDFTPVAGDFLIEELEWDFYEVPLQLNYYQVHLVTEEGR